jgi:uncharacterized protein
MKQLIEKIEQLVKAKFNEDATGHDWHHIRRVTDMALYIQGKEGGNKELVHLSALLHDISDHKFNGGKLHINGSVASKIILENSGDEELAKRVGEIVDQISFKGALVADSTTCLEAKIVQDADRLDAIGAIGIARAFAFGGNRNRPIYEPELSPKAHASFEEYANSKSHTVNHFYEKLLLLKDRLHTVTAREIGEQRHHFMTSFLDQFYAEWEIKGN